MKSRFSEFSYGFALTNEMVGLTDLQIAPIFPTLIEEGKKGVGYDVKLDAPGVPLFLQFKRSDYMTRSTAREWKAANAVGQPLNLPFHRFPITPKPESNQHSSLVGLDQFPNQVFYVAPRFHEIDQLNRAWFSQRVAAESIFVRPQDIGQILDDDHHTIAFDEYREYFFSEPKPLKVFNVHDIAEMLTVGIDENSQPLRERASDWEEAVRRAPMQAERERREVAGALARENGRRSVPSDTPIKTVLRRPSFPSEPVQTPSIRSSEEADQTRQALVRIGDLARMNLEAQFFVAQKKN